MTGDKFQPNLKAGRFEKIKNGKTLPSNDVIHTVEGSGENAVFFHGSRFVLVVFRFVSVRNLSEKETWKLFAKLAQG